MLSKPTRLWLCTRAMDMRRSYDGLAAVVRAELGGDPLSGEGFVFINRRGTQLKLLYFDGDGYCVWSKRLERGIFGRSQASDQPVAALSQTQFAALLEGLDITIRSRRQRWHRKAPDGGVSSRPSV
jgi:transposase